MAFKLTKKVAEKYFRTLLTTRGEGKKPCAFAIAQERKLNRFVFVAVRGSMATARSQAGRAFNWDGGDPKYLEKGKDHKFPILMHGLAKLDGAKLTVWSAKTDRSGVNRAAFSFFKQGNKLAKPFGKIEMRSLRDEDEEAYEPLSDDAAEAYDPATEVSDDELQSALDEFANQGLDEDDDEAGEATADEAEAVDAAQRAEAAATPRPEPQPIGDPPADEGEEGDDEEEDEDEEDDEEARAFRARVQEASQKVAPELVEMIKARAEKIAEVAGANMKLLDIHGANPAALVAWLVNGLVLRAAELPPEQQAAAMENLLQRYMLAMASAATLQEVAQIKKGKIAAKMTRPQTSDTGQPQQRPVPEALIDIERLSDEEVATDEVVETLFAKMRNEAERLGLPFDLRQASDDKIRQMLGDRWDKMPDTEQRLVLLQRLNDALNGRLMAAKSKGQAALEKEMAALFSLDGDARLSDDDAPLAEGIARLRGGCGLALSDAEKMKADADAALREEDPKWTVRSLGGHWGHVDAFIDMANADGVVEAVRSVMGTQGPARAQAIAAARGLIEQASGSVANSNIALLLAQAPFGNGEYIASHLTHGLRELREALDRAESQTASAA